MKYEDTLEKVIVRLDREEKEKDRRIAELEKEIETDNVNLSRQFDLLQEAGLRVEELERECVIKGNIIIGYEGATQMLLDSCSNKTQEDAMLKLEEILKEKGNE
tara:strand:- start:355 stop:666 length:312 start_codon:yes stop_codon:yes gene_type:complete